MLPQFYMPTTKRKHPSKPLRTETRFIKMLHDELQVTRSCRALCIRKGCEHKLVVAVALCAASVEFRSEKLLQHLVEREMLLAFAQDLAAQ